MRGERVAPSHGSRSLTTLTRKSQSHTILGSERVTSELLAELIALKLIKITVS